MKARRQRELGVRLSRKDRSSLASLFTLELKEGGSKGSGSSALYNCF
jgi:hypothetical protein